MNRDIFQGIQQFVDLASQCQFLAMIEGIDPQSMYQILNQYQLKFHLLGYDIDFVLKNDPSNFLDKQVPLFIQKVNEKKQSLQNVLDQFEL